MGGTRLAYRSRTIGSVQELELSDPPEREDEAPIRAPGWTRIVPWPGRRPELPARQWRVLGLLGVAELVDHYDIGLVGALLLQIQRDLGIAEHEIGLLSAVIRAGVLLALGAGVLADRYGRRRLLMATITGYSLTTLASAFAPSPYVFTAVQCLGRAFLYAETAVAIVVVTEELGARDRGYGLGLLGALGALGHGVAAIGLSVEPYLPWGWRALYALGALPLLGLAWLRRNLPETRRFEAGASIAHGLWHPVIAFFSAYPGRAAGLFAVAFTADFAAGAAGGLMVKTLQELHGWPQTRVTLLYILGGVLAIAGNQAAGLWSDRVGRRPVLAALLCLMAVAFAGFYNLRGWVVIPLWIVQVFALQGATVLVRALGSELFPTSYRTTASSARLLAATLGGSAGFVLESYLYGVFGSHAAAITALLPACPIAAVLVFALLPEPAARELEEVSPERGGS